jgi:hypothetical protein
MSTLLISKASRNWGLNEFLMKNPPKGGFTGCYLRDWVNNAFLKHLIHQK